MSKNGPLFDDKVSETLFCNISFRYRELIKCEGYLMVMQLQITGCHQSQIFLGIFSVLTSHAAVQFINPRSTHVPVQLLRGTFENLGSSWVAACV